MADCRDEFCFFRGIHVRIDVRIDIFITIRPMTTNVGNQVHLEDLTFVVRSSVKLIIVPTLIS